MAEDRRVTRTKRRLKQALLELIDEVGYDAITIEELAKRADVARSTFYSHYGDKEELLFAGFESWLLSFREQAEACSGSRFRLHFALPLLRHAASQRHFFENTIVRGGSHRVRQHLQEILAAVARRELTEGAGGDAGSGIGEAEASEAEARASAESTARGRAIAGAFLGLLAWWFEEGARFTPEEVDRIFQETVARPAL